MKTVFNPKKFIKPSRLIPPAPRAILSNGLCVANFSSPHPFNFTDGSEIDPCTDERCNMGSLICNETEVPGIKGTTDLTITWETTPAVIDMIKVLEKDDEVDIVLVPFPVMTALKGKFDTLPSKVRVIRVADRISKKIHIDKFCV